jgi:hypothetical protein
MNRKKLPLIFNYLQAAIIFGRSRVAPSPSPSPPMGEGYPRTEVHGFDARIFRRILSPDPPCSRTGAAGGGEGESQPVVVIIAKMKNSPGQQGHERNRNVSGGKGTRQCWLYFARGYFHSFRDANPDPERREKIPPGYKKELLI